MSAIDRLDSPGPHKLLALDGGGIRGVITLRVLARIEAILQAALDRDDTFVLADYRHLPVPGMAGRANLDVLRAERRGNVRSSLRPQAVPL
jgi:hypothetical protein